ncbi:uncharacterized protein LOC102808694 [Saccoglossus kowalevskii]|uniref:DEAD-box ATP-dependent RNA helicase 42-like n=1 Tax=Saccoglossus kowalevskii TaxID=10224 RepID=A0ABM0LYK2_SACKO|nr:PREDICTED: DEAD-box ATP-dependent RNA helicase 42-like [Saccoglossus kowalevskii]
MESDAADTTVLEIEAPLKRQKRKKKKSRDRNENNRKEEYNMQIISNDAAILEVKTRECRDNERQSNEIVVKHTDDNHEERTRKIKKTKSGETRERHEKCPKADSRTESEKVERRRRKEKKSRNLEKDRDIEIKDDAQKYKSSKRNDRKKSKDKVETTSTNEDVNVAFKKHKNVHRARQRDRDDDEASGGVVEQNDRTVTVNDRSEKRQHFPAGYRDKRVQDGRKGRKSRRQNKNDDEALRNDKERDIEAGGDHDVAHRTDSEINRKKNKRHVREDGDVRKTRENRRGSEDKRQRKTRRSQHVDNPRQKAQRNLKESDGARKNSDESSPRSILKSNGNGSDENRADTYNIHTHGHYDIVEIEKVENRPTSSNSDENRKDGSVKFSVVEDASVAKARRESSQDNTADDSESSSFSAWSTGSSESESDTSNIPRQKGSNVRQKRRAYKKDSMSESQSESESDNSGSLSESEYTTEYDSESGSESSYTDSSSGSSEYETETETDSDYSDYESGSETDSSYSKNSEDEADGSRRTAYVIKKKRDSVEHNPINEKDDSNNAASNKSTTVSRSCLVM